jgi:hypothetical protein
MGLNQTRGLVVGFLGLIPGIFGFLAWELKENWRLYRANQSPTLDPEMIGGHGERMIHFIRPGFHSGTLPKLFARLRRRTGSAEHRIEEGLHHAEEELRRFVERDLVAVLAHSRRWDGAGRVTAGAIHLATNRIRIELCRPGSTSALIDFDNQGGWLIAGFARAGWVESLTGSPRQALHDTLAGFYKKAGVVVVREQMPAGTEVDFTSDGLIVWSDRNREAGLRFDPRHPDAPGEPIGSAARNATDVLFTAIDITWSDWVAQWQADASGQSGATALASGTRLLPGGTN